MFHFFAQTEPKKQKRDVGKVVDGKVVTSGGGQKQKASAKATTEKSPLHRLVRHGYSLTWFTYIFDCLQPTKHENLQLRPLCKLFSEALKPLPCWTSFPHPEYSTLRALFARFDALEAPPALLPALLLIKNGTHNEGGNHVNDGNHVSINIPISIVGESREGCIVLGGLCIRGKKEDDVNVSNLTLRGTNGSGVYGFYGASIHLDNVSVENSGRNGVDLWGTQRNSMKNCNIIYSKLCGLHVCEHGLMTIEGKDTTIHRNCIGGNGFGLMANSFSSIHLVSPLTIETVSKNNYRNRNVGGQGTIAIVDSDGFQIIIITQRH